MLLSNYAGPPLSRVGDECTSSCHRSNDILLSSFVSLSPSLPTYQKQYSR